jgi:hypothetical protein
MIEKECAVCGASNERIVFVPVEPGKREELALCDEHWEEYEFSPLVVDDDGDVRRQ